MMPHSSFFHFSVFPPPQISICGVWCQINFSVFPPPQISICGVLWNAWLVDLWALPKVKIGIFAMALWATRQYQLVWGFRDFSATTVVAAQCCSPRCGGAAATGKRDGRRETRLSDTEGMLASPCTFPQSFSVIPVKREESEGQSVGKQERGRWGGNFSSYIYKGAKFSIWWAFCLAPSSLHLSQ